MNTAADINNKGKMDRKRVVSRPCDACAVRRVRCDLATSQTGSCSNCINHSLECTSVRVRHKSGPKRIKQKTRDQIVNLLSKGNSQLERVNQNTFTQSNVPINVPLSAPSQLPVDPTPNSNQVVTCNIPLDKLLPYLQIYQTWYYGLWPVLSVAHLVSKIIDNNIIGQQGISNSTNNGKVTLDERNAPAYQLCCAVCATIAVQVRFLSSAAGVINVENALSADEYAQEAKRVKYLFEDKIDPTIDTLLTSFFIHMYYGNITGGGKRAVVYLREAISVAQMLGLHDPEAYPGKSSAEIHRCKKIYYMLLVTERYTCFQEKLPVLLDPTVDMPSLQDEEYPELLLGFTELVEVFSATEKQFFQEINHKLLLSDSDNGKLADADLSMFQDFLQNQTTDMKRQWIGQMQSKLNKTIEQNKIANDSQKLNIVLSKSWFQSLGWLISSENFLINQNESMDNCFSVKFPMKIAHDFLTQTKDLPVFAYESNGTPGVCYKLLEIADSLYSVSIMSTHQRESSLAFDQLNTIFGMILKFKGPDVHLPQNLFSKIENLIESKRITFRQPDPFDLLMEPPSQQQLQQQQQQHRHHHQQNTPSQNENGRPQELQIGQQANNLISPNDPMSEEMKTGLSPYSQFTMCYYIPPTPSAVQSNQITEL